MPSPLLNAIAELESNGLATRSWVVAGLCLGLCQRCECWAGTGCSRISLIPGPFAEWLVSEANTCERWVKLHADATAE